jgi:hypothetical protein
MEQRLAGCEQKVRPWIQATSAFAPCTFSASWMQVMPMIQEGRVVTGGQLQEGRVVTGQHQNDCLGTLVEKGTRPTRLPLQQCIYRFFRSIGWCKQWWSQSRFSDTNTMAPFLFKIPSQLK